MGHGAGAQGPGQGHWVHEARETHGAHEARSNELEKKESERKAF